MPTYRVRQGECLNSIALAHGITWQKIWNHGDNSALRDRRRDPNVLLPGDELWIPEKSTRTEVGGTEARHRFVRLQVPSKLRLRLLEFEKPLVNVPYTLDVDGKAVEGFTDQEGILECVIAPNAKTGLLRICQGSVVREVRVELGVLDPLNEPSGVVQRLGNLGYSYADVTSAVRRFQADVGLKESGKLDDATRAALRDRHQS